MTPTVGLTVARYACLMLPLAALAAAALPGSAALAALRPGAPMPDPARRRRLHGAGLLSFVAAATGIAALDAVAQGLGWWSYAPVDAAWRGLPVDLWLGWAVLWGPVPVLAHRVLRTPVALLLLLWLDLLAMPRLDPLVELGPHWWLGELAGIVAVALPAQLLGRWTARDLRLYPRALLQLTTFAGTVLWLIPTTAFTYGDGSWGHLWRLPSGVLPLLAQLAALVSVPALAAMREFAVRGHGTPYPWDPPKRLVITGPYAYLANPMQLSASLLLVVLAVGAASATLAVAAVAAVAFSVALAAPHERADLDGRFGHAWRAYRTQVRDWVPRLRPLPQPAATVWLDRDCGPCAAVTRWLLHRHPAHLVVAAAADHPQVLWRARYTGPDGHHARGAAAIARALEHTHLGWAYLGWLLLLPPVAWLAQQLTDAFITAPHPARPETAAHST
ncbi:methyltransferase [Catellatospora tritici]|uniref:methyltransferase n=1 Tax=Catellatospora tritici TaxID=2851566 RepID=UPI001C2D1A38|nr:methyltransferase [Catellatospora tritici]MBV1856330.1 isoprenylcysteine carboxylmethyltransferase family protein [Catellatospora tritici]